MDRFTPSHRTLSMFVAVMQHCIRSRGWKSHVQDTNTGDTMQIVFGARELVRSARGIDIIIARVSFCIIFLPAHAPLADKSSKLTAKAHPRFPSCIAYISPLLYRVHASVWTRNIAGGTRIVHIYWHEMARRIKTSPEHRCVSCKTSHLSSLSFSLTPLFFYIDVSSPFSSVRIIRLIIPAILPSIIAA